MKYNINFCPHCGHQVGFSSSVSEKEYGSPFKTCSKCKRQYIDSNVIEPAAEGYNPPDMDKANKSCLVRLIIGIVLLSLSALFYILVHFENVNFDAAVFLLVFCIAFIFFGGSLFVIGLISLISYKRNYNKILKQYNALYNDSLIRLSDSDYALALKNAGYNVPLKFLDLSSK